MSTEVDIYQPRATVAVHERDVVDGWVSVVKDVARLADHIADTDFVPKALRNRPAAIAACMLTGREIGIGPMQSMKVIHMVQGSPSLAAEFKRARAMAAGHEIVFDETTTTRCVVRGRRKGEDSWLKIEWHIDDAKRAKLLGKDVWQQHPRRMLEARASSELCDLKFPDCSWGLPTTEVLEDGAEILDDGTVIEASDAKAIEAPKPRTAQRRRPATTVPPKDPTPASAAASATTSEATTPDAPAQTARPTRTDDGLPPLPGEEDEQPAQPPFDPDARGTSTRGKGGQLTALWTVLNTVYLFTDKDEARKVVESLISRQLDGGTTGDLSFNEAKGVLNSLDLIRVHAEKEKITPREQLIVFLTKIDESRGGDGG